MRPRQKLEDNYNSVETLTSDINCYCQLLGQATPSNLDGFQCLDSFLFGPELVTCVLPIVILADGLNAFIEFGNQTKFGIFDDSRELNGTSNQT